MYRFPNTRREEPGSYGYAGGSPAGRRRRFLWAPIVLALIFAAVQYFGAQTYVNPVTGKSVRVAMSTEQEAALGLQSFREVLSQSRTIESGPEVDMVKRVVERLIRVVDPESQSFEWSAAVIESDQMNAFCLPGGKIAVYTGILRAAPDDDSLAVVLGHEIAHATARHGSQRILQQNLLNTAMMGVSGATSDMDPDKRRMVLGALGAGAQFGILLPYGRDHETEADLVGLVYLIRAGYRPEAAVTFWEAMEKAGGSQPPELMSTHPSHGTRIARLRELIDEYRRNGTISGMPIEAVQ